MNGSANFNAETSTVAIYRLHAVYLKLNNTTRYTDVYTVQHISISIYMNTSVPSVCPLPDVRGRGAASPLTSHVTKGGRGYRYGVHCGGVSYKQGQAEQHRSNS